MIRHAVLCVACLAVVACSGADGSSLYDGDGGSAPLDATAPVDSSAAPDGGGDASTLDAGAVDVQSKDAPSPNKDPGIACGKSDCDPSTELCCSTITSYYPQYTYAFACEAKTDLVQCAAGIGVYCDDDHDCEGGQLCCGDLGYQSYAKVSCKPTCTGVAFGYQQIHFCDPKAPDCDVNQTCAQSTVMPGYFVCQ
jgi:hypothetical protein